jgi:hypothetical protein
MTKSIRVTPKKARGRPATGRDPHVTARMPTALIVEVEAWAVANDASRSEAIRRLVEIGLRAKPISSERVGRGRSLDLGTMAKIEPAAKAARSSRAAELAAVAIEKMSDASAPADERDERRRRLTKGPPEFREVRVDRPKAKKGK